MCHPYEGGGRGGLARLLPAGGPPHPRHLPRGCRCFGLASSPCGTSPPLPRGGRCGPSPLQILLRHGAASPQPALEPARSRGAGGTWRDRGHEDQVDIFRRHPGPFQSDPCRFEGQVRCRMIWRSDPALHDPGQGSEPLVLRGLPGYNGLPDYLLVPATSRIDWFSWHGGSMMVSRGGYVSWWQRRSLLRFGGSALRAAHLVPYTYVTPNPPRGVWSQGSLAHRNPKRFEE